MIRSRTKTITLAMLVLMVLAPFIAVQPVAACTEGCTPGYWKNHLDAWVGYNPTDPVAGVFDVPSSDLNGDGTDDTLLDALKYKGGRGKEGAARILLRAGVAALLNAAHGDLDAYPETWVLNRVNWAFRGPRPFMLRLALRLDRANNLDCPL